MLPPISSFPESKKKNSKLFCWQHNAEGLHFVSNFVQYDIFGNQVLSMSSCTDARWQICGEGNWGAWLQQNQISGKLWVVEEQGRI